MDKKEVKNKSIKGHQDKKEEQSVMFPRRVINLIADEVANIVIKRIPLPNRQPKKGKKKNNKKKEAENAVFLDTSAIIDGRIFDVFEMGLLSGPVVVLESVLLELKHIADTQDTVKRERGRKGLELLERLKKIKRVKHMVLADSEEAKKRNEVDEMLIHAAKQYKGRIITCDYNLEKKATVQNVVAVNMNALSQKLKVAAVPGESLHVKVLHQGKDPTQGVGYLEDGTMIVVEQGKDMIGRTIDVVVSRVIQTAAGKILFSKKI